MHTMEIKTDDGDRLIVNYNSDWSGVVYLKWWRGGEMMAEMSLPGNALVKLATAVAGRAVRDQIIDLLEGMPLGAAKEKR